jgi:hypothetical protein
MSTRWRAAWRRRHLIAEAGIALMRARLTVLVRRGSRLAAVLGEPVSEAAATPLSPQQLAQAREVGWAIELLAVRGPLRTACLGQALAARALLQRREIPCVLTLGLGRHDHSHLRAHAWLRAGNLTITGGRGRSAFSPVAGFH